MTMFDETNGSPSRDKIGDWVLRGGIALAFVLFGAEKFPSGPGAQWVKFFEQVGVGQWFRYVTGVVEILGAALVLIPWTARAGLALLAATMASAALILGFRLHKPGDSIISTTLSLGLAAFWWIGRER